MPRVTNLEACARRAKVAEAWVKGRALTAIAADLGCEWRTVRRDVGVLAAEAARELDVPRELARLLLAGRAAESAAWDGGQLGLVLSAQRQQVLVLQALAALDVERRLEAVEAALATLSAGTEGSQFGNFQTPNGAAHAPV